MAIDRSRLRRLRARLLTAPVDIAALAAFRILFGLLMAWAMGRFLAKGWVGELYLEPAFHFTYPGFGWVRPWPDAMMYVHFVLLGLLGLAVAVGWHYRVCMALFFLGFTYVELLDQTTYLNHYYFISLISGLLIFLPAHRAWSIDAFRRPELRLESVPAWALNILRLQVSVVYFFAGLAKLNADWLFHAQPLRIWLAARSDLPLIGSCLAEPWLAYAASWFGFIFDLTVVFFLCWRRSRPWAYAAVVFFHVATALLFDIGMFPWIMMVAATLLFAADWPRPLLQRLGRVLSMKLGWVGQLPVRESGWVTSPPACLPGGRRQGVVLIPLAVYAAVQLLLPLRPYVSSQPPAWTGDGFNCAWQVMIVEKTGYAEFFAVDPASGQRWRVPVNDYLTARQQIMMAQDPYLIRALARRMAEDLRARGYIDIQIKVDAFATLNGRPSQRLVDPELDLARPGLKGWIVPLLDRAEEFSPGLDLLSGG